MINYSYILIFLFFMKYIVIQIRYKNCLYLIYNRVNRGKQWLKTKVNKNQNH